MSLAHDGHCVTCVACRVPLRAKLVTESGLRFVAGDVTVDEVQAESVECENCGADLGPLDRVQDQYAELVRHG